MLKLIIELFVLIQIMVSLIFSEEIPNTYKNIPDCYLNCSFEDRKMLYRNVFNELMWSHSEQDIVKNNQNQIDIKDAISNESRRNPENTLKEVSWILYHIPPIHLKRRKRTAFLNIYQVAIVLSKHKYRGKDPRHLHSDQGLYNEFPMPPAMHPTVRRECDLGVEKCINEVASFEKFRRSSGKLERVTEIDEFEYLTTASYYMCWYTMLRRELLVKLDMKNIHNFQCLQFNNLQRADTISESFVKIPKQMLIYDVRLKNHRRPFLCAELSFCPDPCYGRETHGNILNLDRDNSNPCFIYPDARCIVEHTKNRDLKHMIENGLNYSCNCKQINEGFIWNKELKLCVDLDECAEGFHNCPKHMICQNTIGSFNCLCAWGYHWIHGSCTDAPLKHQTITPVEYSEPLDEEDLFSGEQIMKSQNYLKTLVLIFIGTYIF